MKSQLTGASIYGAARFVRIGFMRLMLLQRQLTAFVVRLVEPVEVVAYSRASCMPDLRCQAAWRSSNKPTLPLMIFWSFVTCWCLHKTPRPCTSQIISPRYSTAPIARSPPL